jgi:nitroimidazol reductase NimA-like FMN-containing flavoprotein (pyridoxamine 5'-phosphate oxidase superfamily)
MPSRRDQIEMSSDEIRSYLRSQMRLILVSNGPDGYPHPMPMNFIIDDEDRYAIITFRKSQKVKNLTRDPRAALLVESGIAYGELKSVLAYAEAEIIDDVELVLDIMAGLADKEMNAVSTFSPEVREQARQTAVKRVAIRFKPDRYITWDHSKLGGRY